MRPIPAVLALGAATFVASHAAAQAVEPAVAFGTRHAVALRSNGDVLTWGDNVSCQLGRAAGNASRTPGLVMRNATAVAAAAEHTLVLAEGKVYGWGANPDGVLGTGDEYEKCEGPALAESLASQTVVAIATGYSVSLAVTSDGDLYCAGDNEMGQCPVGRGGALVFTKIPIPELQGTVAEVRAGAHHALIRTRDGALYALGRGRDGQLGNGKTTNGFARVTEVTGVTSFAAGMWHSVAAGADGSVWTWGNGAKAQLCDGGPANRATPQRVTLPAGVRVAQVAAGGGHGTLLRTGDGALLACGDNQFGQLGRNQPLMPEPTAIQTPKVKTILALGGAHAAISGDGCDVRLAGSNDHGVAAAADAGTVQTFSLRTGFSLCAARPAAPLPTIVNPAPKGGESGCWTTRVQEDAVATAKFAGLRQAMLEAEALLRKQPAFLAAPQPSRFRTSMSAGPSEDSGARMHIKVVPERKPDGSRLWAKGCEVIPQIDRIGGAIAQISIFFNQDARSQFLGQAGEPPKRTGTVAGYPEYDNWVLITKNGRVPWLPQTLADRLDAELVKRREALEEAKRRPTGLPADAAGGVTWLEKQVKDAEAYRASFTAEQLRAPAVWGDPTGSGRRQLEAEAATLRNLSPADQQRFDALGLESRTLERQAQAAAKAGDAAEAERLRARSRALAIEARGIRQAHMERAAPRIIDGLATYDLRNLRPGDASASMRAKRDPALPDMSTPNKVQVISVLFSFGPKPTGAQLEWRTKVIESFDFAALAALLD